MRGEVRTLPQLADDSYYLEERYRGETVYSPALSAFYAIKPLVPRALQVAARRRLARTRVRRSFPAWPVEDILERRRAVAVREQLAARGAERLPFVNFWPAGQRFAVILTHDVEGSRGVQRIPELLDIERRHGFVSSWNFVAEGYPLTAQDRAGVVAADCEVGLHGITHDGRLFRDRATFDEQLPMIRRYLEDWGAVGFRSPSTLRNADWMHELPCLYDSSFPQSDPFQPQAGGCLSIFPFFFGNVVELPITLDQDYTVFELLRHHDIDLWIRKSEWIISHHGLINVIVHPDYVTRERLALYEQFLVFLRAQQGGWHALPREVARWWSVRAQLQCLDEDGVPTIVGDHDDTATVAWARMAGDEVTYDLD